MNRIAYGTTKIARICHVTPPTIGRWIKEGKIPSFSTGGGQKRVWEDDLAAFLRVHNIPFPPASGGAKGPRILLVEDDLDIRKIMKGFLMRRWPKAEVLEAGDVFEAGKHLLEASMELVVLDVRLPGVSGLEILKALRAHPGINGARVLAVTAFGSSQVEKALDEAGADAFLEKPFKRVEFIKTIGRLLNEPRKV